MLTIAEVFLKIKSYDFIQDSNESKNINCWSIFSSFEYWLLINIQFIWILITNKILHGHPVWGLFVLIWGEVTGIIIAEISLKWIACNSSRFKWI